MDSIRDEKDHEVTFENLDRSDTTSDRNGGKGQSPLLQDAPPPIKPLPNLYIQYIQHMTVVFRTPNLKYKVNERDHLPPHVHIEGKGCSVRINLLSLEIMDTDTKFSISTLREIFEFVGRNQRLLLDEWEARHGKN